MITIGGGNGCEGLERAGRRSPNGTLHRPPCSLAGVHHVQVSIGDGFRTQVASDVSDRDGLGVELLHESTGGEVWAEIFRDDTNKTLLIRVFTDRPVPFDVARQWFDLGGTLLPFMPGRDGDQGI